MGSVPSVSRWVQVFHRAWASTSPAAPYQTVHAVLPHTASRHRASSGMRSPPSPDGSFEAIDAEVGQPVVAEATGSKSRSGGVLDTGQLGHPQVHVAVDGCELRVGVPIAEVGPPTPKHGGEVIDDVMQ